MRIVHVCLALVLTMLLGALPTVALERPFRLAGMGFVAFTFDEEGNISGGTVTGSGTATHLGRWTEVGTLSATPDPNDPTLVLISGEFIFTAANGNVLNVEFSDAVFDTTSGLVTGTGFFIGGTGRFQQASGSTDFEVQQDLAGPFLITATGTIDF